MPADSAHMSDRRSRMPVLALTRACSCALVALALSLGVAMPAGATSFSAGQNADLLLGSTSWTAHQHDDGTKMGYGMFQPNGVAVDGSGSLYVADTEQNRLMRWAATPTLNGEAMTNVLMKSGGSHTNWDNSCSAGSDRPEQMSIAGDGVTLKMAVADRYGHRIALFSGEPTSNGTTGTVFLGQASSSACTANRGGATAANTLDSPSAVWTDGTRVAATDS